MLSGACFCWPHVGTGDRPAGDHVSARGADVAGCRRPAGIVWRPRSCVPMPPFPPASPGRTCTKSGKPFQAVPVGRFVIMPRAAWHDAAVRSVPWPVLLEMLDEDRQMHNFREQLPDGRLVPDETAARMTMIYALRAIGEWHKKQASKEVSPELRQGLRRRGQTGEQPGDGGQNPGGQRTVALFSLSEPRLRHSSSSPQGRLIAHAAAPRFRSGAWCAPVTTMLMINKCRLAGSPEPCRPIPPNKHRCPGSTHGLPGPRTPLLF